MNISTAPNAASNYGKLMDAPVKNETKPAMDISPADSHDCPLAVLVSEHEAALKQLNKMAAAAKSIQQNGFSAENFRQIADAIRYIGSVVRKHNEKEEQFLFPKLDRHVNGYQSMMRHQHRELWAAFTELSKAVKDVEDGRIHGSSIRDLLQMANFIIDHLSNHIAQENTVLFPMAKRLLTPEEYKELTAEIQSTLHRS